MHDILDVSFHSYLHQFSQVAFFLLLACPLFVLSVLASQKKSPDFCVKMHAAAATAKKKEKIDRDRERKSALGVTGTPRRGKEETFPSRARPEGGKIRV